MPPNSSLISFPTTPEAQLKSTPLDTIRAVLDKADMSYFNGGNREAVIPDHIYDMYKAQLKLLCPADERLHRVGAPISNENALRKVKHLHMMGSLDNALNPEEFWAWISFIRRTYPKATFHCSYKMDGGSSSLYYMNGEYVAATTRGDGETGSDITATAARIRNIPLRLTKPDGKPYTGYIRGEVMLEKSAWAEVDPEFESNPRNLGNGMMQRSDGENAEKLSFFAFRCFDHKGAVTEVTEGGMSRFMQAMGLTVAPFIVDETQDLSVVAAWYDMMTVPGPDGETLRSTLPFEIDGLVVKVNELVSQFGLGEASNRPKGQVAYKFPPAGAVTTLLDVEYSLGSTGAIIPVAILSPVRIGGVTVERSTLCNFDEIKRLDIAIGDKVRVVRQADVVPKVVSKVSDGENRKLIETPTKCPVTGGKVGHIDNLDGSRSAHLYSLEAMDSAPVKIARLLRWVRELNILGMGEVYINALFNSTWENTDKRILETPADLYRLKDIGFKFLKKDGKTIIGESSTRAILDEIEKTRELTLPQFIAAAVPGIGKARVQSVMEAMPGEFDTLEDWMSGKLTLNADKIGLPKMASKFSKMLKTEKDFIHDLFAAGVKLKIETTVIKKPAFVFCLTGEFPKPKDFYHNMAAQNGHAYVPSFTKKVTHVVSNSQDMLTNKAKKAREKGIPIISPDEMIALMQKYKDDNK